MEGSKVLCMKPYQRQHCINHIAKTFYKREKHLIEINWRVEAKGGREADTGAGK